MRMRARSVLGLCFVLGAAHCAADGSVNDDAVSPPNDAGVDAAADGAGVDAGHDSGSVQDASIDSPPVQDANVPDAADAGLPTTLYVAPAGNGDCSLATPCALETARDKARAIRASADAQVTILLREGVYRRTTPFTLGPADSGSQTRPVVYDAYPGEHPILSGAVQITGWAAGAQPSVWNAQLPAGVRPRQLYVNGVRAPRAESVRGALSFTAVANGLASTAATSPVSTWTYRPGLEVTHDNAWKHMRCPIVGISQTPNPPPAPLNGGAPAAAGGTMLIVDPVCWANNQLHVPNLGYPFNGSGLPALSSVTTLESALELMDAPGEFYADTATGALSYMPRNGETMAAADVEAPALQSLVVLQGAPGHLVLTNQDDSAATYTGAWSTSGARALGDWKDDVAYTTAPDASLDFSFHGTGIDVLGETNTDEGDIDVTVTSKSTSAVVLQQTVSAHASERLAQQAIVSVSGLPLDDYRVTAKKHANDGTFLVVDAFVILPDPIATVHDIVFRHIAFEHTAWSAPGTDGYVDNQAGILWDPATHLPIRMPSAVRVSRGERIEISGNTFTHLGAGGVELADGTQGTFVVGNRFDDISGGAIFVGEVDDVYLNDAMTSGRARMTSGNTISNNAITRSGVDYHDTVAVWVGNARSTTIAHNVIAHEPYTGISVGWGWGWASNCANQASAGVSPCRHGTTYNGSNQIIANRISDVMRTLFDGGPIYTLGGQAAIGGVAPSLQGNVLSTPAQCAHMIYHDEGSSYWQTYDNILYDTQCRWVGMWIKTIHDIQVGVAGPNFTDNPQAGLDNGTSDTVTPPTLLSLSPWPAAAASIESAAGLEPAYASLYEEGKTLEDSDGRLRYSSDSNGPQWIANLYRNLGDQQDDVHYATADGATVALTFTSTGITILGEKQADQGGLVITLDGSIQGTVDTSTPQGAPRLVRQVIFEAHGLTAGTHTITARKQGGTFATIDAFVLD